VGLAIEIGLSGNYAPPLEGVIRSAQRSETLGYASIWWPDRLMGWYPPVIWEPSLSKIVNHQKNPSIFMDPVSCITAAGLNTSKIRMGTAVTEVFRRHPAMLAQSALTLDHICKGRFILGIGPGEGCNVLPYGLPYTDHAARLEEAVKIIRLLWENDGPVSFEGRFWRLKDAVLGLGPYQEGRYPPIWIAATGPKMLAVTATLADGWLPLRRSPKEYGKMLATIRRIARENGRDMSHFNAGMYANLIVDEKHEECHRMIDTTPVKIWGLVASWELYDRLGIQHPLGDRFYGLVDFIPTQFQRAKTLQALAKVPFEAVHEYIMHGTPDELLGAISEYIQQGLQHLVISNVTPVADMDKVRSSFEGIFYILSKIRESGGNNG